MSKELTLVSSTISSREPKFFIYGMTKESKGKKIFLGEFTYVASTSSNVAAINIGDKEDPKIFRYEDYFLISISAKKLNEDDLFLDEELNRKEDSKV